jgi:hypothetical protein
MFVGVGHLLRIFWRLIWEVPVLNSLKLKLWLAN